MPSLKMGVSFADVDWCDVAVHKIKMLGITSKQAFNGICVYTIRINGNDDEHRYPRREGIVKRMHPSVLIQPYFSEHIGAANPNCGDRISRDTSKAVILRTGNLRVKWLFCES